MYSRNQFGGLSIECVSIIGEVFEAEDYFFTLRARETEAGVTWLIKRSSGKEWSTLTPLMLENLDLTIKDAKSDWVYKSSDGTHDYEAVFIDTFFDNSKIQSVGELEARLESGSIILNSTRFMVPMLVPKDFDNFKEP